MKITLSFLALASIIAISSCSSAYKTTQTPDDVYYSPSSQKNRAAVAGDDQPEYYSTNNPSDQYVQMKVQDEARWSYFDDYNYYDSYYSPDVAAPYWGSGYGLYGGSGLGFGLGFGMGYYNPYSYWNSYYAWNSYYNPYFYNPHYGGGVIIANPRYYSYGTTAYSGLRAFSPASYRSTGISTNSSNRFYTPGASNSNNNVRNTYVPATNSNNNTYSRPSNNTNYQPSSQPARTYTPSSGGGSGGISRPGRN